MIDPDRIQKVENLVRQFLEAIGEDPSREGLIDTPARVAKAWVNEFCHGIQQSEDDLVPLVKTFHDPNAVGQFIAIRDITFSSFCEHHLLPFVGEAHVVYIPNGKGVINGLSKVGRVLDLLAARPQVQERITGQLFNVLDRALEPKALLVYLSAVHFCLSCRGAKKAEARTRTMKHGGLFETDTALFSIALDLVR